MKVIRTSFYDDGFLGDTQIECDCGFQFIKEDAMVDDEVECPICKKKGIIRSKVVVWVEGC